MCQSVLRTESRPFIGDQADNKEGGMPSDIVSWALEEHLGFKHQNPQDVLWLREVVEGEGKSQAKKIMADHSRDLPHLLHL